MKKRNPFIWLIAVAGGLAAISAFAKGRMGCGCGTVGCSCLGRLSASEVDSAELAYGQALEMAEHGCSPEQAEKLALDHLTEHPNYYTKLRKCGIR